MSKKGMHRPFEKLKEVVLPEKKASTQPAGQDRAASLSDQDLFAEEMGGALPLPQDPRGHRNVERHSDRLPNRRHRNDAEVLAALTDLVATGGTFDVVDGDELLEGIAPNVDRRLLKRLRQGDFSVERHVDLHGQTVEEARANLERF